MLRLVSVARPRWERRRRVVKVVIVLACVLLVVGAGTVIIALISGASLKETKRDLAIAAPIVVIVAGLAGIGSKLRSTLQSQGAKRDRSRLVHAQLVDSDRLVDRSGEMVELIQALARSREVNCWGQKGAGKSFLLKHFADVINGYRAENSGHPKARKVSAALYFDVADTVGFAEIEARVCREVLGKENGTWNDFIAYVTKKFPRRRILLILDNANTPSLWPAVGRAAYDYLAQRPGDCLILGSVSKVTLVNITPEPVLVSGLNLASTEELIANRGFVLDREELKKLHAQFNGLPYYTGLFAAIEGGAPGTRATAELETAVDIELIPTLGPQTRRLLAYASLFAVVARQISIDDLEQCPLVNLDAQLEADEGLLTPLADRRRQFGIHDVLRDAVLRTVDPEVSEAALHLFQRARRQGRQVNAALFAMFADPDAIGADAFDAALEPVIRKAVDSRDYSVLESLHGRAKQSSRMQEFITEDQNRHELFCWGHATQLAGLGQYAQAEAELLSTGLLSAARRQVDRGSELDPDMRFLLADITHLQNRYDDAAQMFEELGRWAWETGNKKASRPLCLGSRTRTPTSGEGSRRRSRPLRAGRGVWQPRGRTVFPGLLDHRRDWHQGVS